jgi:hypothetical protein
VGDTRQQAPRNFTVSRGRAVDLAAPHATHDDRSKT